MPLKMNFHKDPLGLMSGEIPQDYLNIVQSLIRPDVKPPVQQKPPTPGIKLYKIQSTQTKPKPSVICVSCQKAKHKFPIFCRKLQKMNPIMRNHGIQCKMCLDTNHITED